MGFSKPITVTNTLVTLLSLLVAAGYAGRPVITVEGSLYNTHATVALYLHFTDSATSPPGTATDGLPVLIGAPSNTFTLPAGTDLSTTWVYAASSITVRTGVIG